MAKLNTKLIQVVYPNGWVVVGYKLTDPVYKSILIEKPVLFKEPTVQPSDIILSTTAIIETLKSTIDLLFELSINDNPPITKRYQHSMITNKINALIENLQQYMITAQLPKPVRFFRNLFKTYQYTGSKGDTTDANPYVIELKIEDAIVVIDFEEEYRKLEKLFKDDEAKLKEAVEQLDMITNDIINQIEKQYDYSLIEKMVKEVNQIQKELEEVQEAPNIIQVQSQNKTNLN